MRSPTLVIMAAGMGSRFGGPKQTTPVDDAGHFILYYSLFDAHRAGFRKVVFIVKPGMEAEFAEALGSGVQEHFDVRFAPQALDALPEGYSVPDGRQKPWGTAHAVLCAAGEIDGPFAVINADDYYGVTAFQVLYDFLAADRPESEYAMVGFRLRNTVTEHGSVARGVCEVENGLLRGVTERTKIVKKDDDAAFTEDDGATWTDLSGDTLVSMNFWGFTPLYLYELAKRFPAFLENEVPKNPLKSEYFVPSVVNAQLQEGSAAIAVLDTPDAWHGVTYPEDLPGVKAALKALTDAGTYPEGFWK